ncbi:MAG: DUF255 domain-containing protein [Candidatus Latescibacterota bacterium]|nr:MAG: DUF255 domain-containing protein [Candidatus Latescibacterota bacterium]
MRLSRGIRLATLMAACGVYTLAWAGDGKEEKKNNGAKPQLAWVPYGEALERAEAEDKHILIDFYTSWCGWCKVMDKKTYTDPAVVEMLNENFLIAKINAESKRKFAVGDTEMSGQQLAQQYGVRSFPMTWFLRPDGTRLANIPGYIPAERFIKALEYVHDREYVKAEQRRAQEGQ